MIDTVGGFHIEPTNICTLKCPGCARTRFIEQWPQHWRNHSIDVDELLRFLDIDLTGKRIGLCGNYGDPIYHNNLIDFVKKLKARGATLSITTNGSYKTQQWWEELVDNLSSTDIINFSVDGTPDNFTNYRVNADWNSIRVGMEVVAKSLCDSSWKYIPFAFNQQDIKSVEKLSQNIGIKNFRVELSDRFDDQTQELIPDSLLLGSRYIPQVEWKYSGSNSKVNQNVKTTKNILSQPKATIARVVI